MDKSRQTFHIISYLQYPLMLAAFYFYIPFITSLFEGVANWSSLNNVLILFGIAMSFSTLQDTRKTQNKLSKRIWQSPRNGLIFLILFGLTAFGCIVIGLVSFYYNQQGILHDVAIGILVLGVGMVGILKAAIEMYENHRLDKNPIRSIENAKETV